jgi:antirestriction protein ArdC
MKHKFNAEANREDVYSRVTAKVIADLEKGVIPWAKPWDAGPADGSIMRPLRHNGEPYAGINILMLWMAAEEQGYASPTWMTYRQALQYGGQVRKGERGTPVVYASTYTKEEEDADSGDAVKKTIPFLKTYTVFNVTQIEGLPGGFYGAPAPAESLIERIENAESFFAATGADVRHGGNRAFYDPQADYIRMPPFETFRDAQSYYATLGHETCHWTRAPTRLDRSFDRKRWGDEGYAQEELVAELGAAYLCADLGLSPVVREDHAAYIASWLTVLKDDKRAIFSAASHAQRALDYLHALQPGTAPSLAPGVESDPDPRDEPQAFMPEETPEPIRLTGQLSFL